MKETPSSAERGVSLVCLAAAGALFALPLANPDVFWHLSAGRWMAEHGALPSADWLSHTRAGAPWSDFEWLAQLLYYAVHSAAGMPGLFALKAALMCAVSAALWRGLGLYGAGPLGRSLGVLGWALASPAANDLRPENFSVLSFILLLTGLERLRREGRDGATAGALAAVCALFVLWANLHAGFVYGIALVALYAAGAAWRARALRPLAPLAAAAAGSLANPFGAGVYAVSFGHWAELAELERYIREWQGASAASPWLIPFWTLLALAFAALAARRLCAKEAPFELAVGGAALALSAVRHVRTLPYFAVTAVFAAAEAASAVLPARWVRRAGVFAALAAVAFTCVQYRPAFARGVGGFDAAGLPVRAAAFLRSHEAAFAGRRLFNPWHWGGYLGWELAGKVPVYFDGRYIFHPLLGPSYAAAADPSSYAAFLDAGRVEAAVIERLPQFMPMEAALKDGSRRRLLRPFYVFYLPREAWALVHWDDDALVFVRRSAFDEKWVRGLEYRWFRPDDLSAASLAVSEGELSFADLAAEANRWAAQAEKPGAANARLWLADQARKP
ncbi:MAG: hypothetical protein HY928_12090 [Elusimicrobia bacterium]|nr:hypothetical protein [Elusimicrobiota bacterium]